MKYFLFLVFALAGLLPAEAQQLKIGVVSALTGGGASYGTDIKNAALFASEVLGQGRTILVIEDDKCSPREAVTAAQKLLSRDRVDFVIGFACSGAALAAAPILERAKIPTLVSCGSSPRIAKSGEYIFRTGANDADFGPLLVSYLKGRYRKVAALTQETDYTTDLLQSLLPAAREAGIEVSSETYFGTDADVRTLLMRAVGKEPEVVFLNQQDEAGLLVAFQQLRAFSNLPVVSAYNPPGQAFLKGAGERADGIVYVDGPNLDASLTAEGRELLRRYEAQYGKPTYTWVVVATIEAFRAVLQVSSEPDRRKALLQQKFNGLIGDWHFDADGEIVSMPLSLWRIKKGVPVPLNP